MSLEIALQENTATMKELIGALQSMGKLEIIPVTAAKKSPAKVTAEAPADPKPEAVTAEPTSADSAQANTADDQSTSAAAASPSEAAPLNYDKDVKPLILRLASVDRQAVVDVLGRFGVTTAKDLKPKQYAQVIADVNNVIAGGAV
jgi:hypothetical protein